MAQKILATWFSGFYGLTLDQLPSDKRTVLHEENAILELFWDSLTAEERAAAVKNWDAQHPVLLSEKDEAKNGFKKGFRIAMLPTIRQKNKKNAELPRPSRQLVTDTALDQLIAQGITCAEAYRRYCTSVSEPISKQGFRNRWNRRTNKKAT